MLLDAYLDAWTPVTSGAMVAIGVWMAITALIAMWLPWMRPGWRPAQVIAAIVIPIPLMLLLFAIAIGISASLDTRPWTDFDKAEAYAAATWIGAIIALPAAILGVIGASCGLAIFLALNRKR